MGAMDSVKIGTDELIKLIIGTPIEERNRIIEENYKTKVNNSFLTVEEVLIMYMYYVESMRPDIIARILGKSRSNIYAALERVRMKYESAKETIRLIEGIMKSIRVYLPSGGRADDALIKLYTTADEKGIKVPYKSYQIKEYMRKKRIVDDYDRFVNDTELIILPGVGIYHHSRERDGNK